MIQYVDLLLNYADDLYLLGLLSGTSGLGLIALPLGTMKTNRRVRRMADEHRAELAESESRLAAKIEELALLEEKRQEGITELSRQREAQEELKSEFDAEKTWRLSVEEQLIQEREKTQELCRKIDDLSQMLQQLRHEKERLRQETDRAKQELESVRRENQTLSLVVEEKRARDQEQGEFLALAKEEFKRSFASLSSAALKYNNEKFVALAAQVLDEKMERGDEQLTERAKEVSGVEESFRLLVLEVERKIEALEEERVRQHMSLEEGLRTVLTSSHKIGDEAAKLREVLAGAGKNVAWGQAALTELLSFSGITHYTYTDTTPSDLLLALPNGKWVSIFAHAPTPDVKEGESFNELQEAEYARSLRNYLSSRIVVQRSDVLLEGVVFIPAEGLLQLALRHDPELIRYAYSRKLVLTTPTTLLGFLSMINAGWRESEVQKRSEEIVALGRELCHRMISMNERFETLGDHLTAAVREYNGTSHSIHRKLLPITQRFEALCEVVGEAIPHSGPLKIVEAGVDELRPLLIGEIQSETEKKEDEKIRNYE